VERRQRVQVDGGSDSGDDDTFMTLAYDRSAGDAVDGVSVCHSEGPVVEETKDGRGPSELPVMRPPTPPMVTPKDP
jgi:hypothetical protein